jgi:hypothetical protein
VKTLEERPTIQEEDPRVTWTRRTGRLVIEVIPGAGGMELRYAVCSDCFGTLLLADGTCPFCTAMRRPHPILGTRNPQYRLDNLGPEDGYTPEDAERDRELLRLAHEYWVTLERDARTLVNGCALCGCEERGHGRRSHHPFRLADRHEYTAPSDRLRLARLRARRTLGDTASEDPQRAWCARPHR